MKKYFLIVLLLSLFSLVACINTSGSNYIESIELYIDDEKTEGKIQYYNKEENEWLDFDEYKGKEKINVYYSFDVSLDKEIKILIQFYTPKITMGEIKAVSSVNFDSRTNQTRFYNSEDKKEDNTKVIITLEDFDGSFNILKVPSWMSDNGIKYQGQKHPNGNYTIWGIHLNIV